MKSDSRELSRKNIRTVLAILQNEIDGDVRSALNKMSRQYSMTWVYRHPKNGKLFPRTTNDIEAELLAVYPIKGRRYDIKNIVANKDIVMVELIESYPDPKTKKIFRTPLVLVLELKNGRIRRGRHYCDPRLSYLHLSKKQINKVFY
jgi:ketosteroid isomerase-like protein